MTFNIVEAIEAKITPDEVKRVAESTGETPSKTRQTMSLGVLAIVGGLVQRFGNPAGASNLLRNLRGGAPLGPTLLGDQAERTMDGLSHSAGVSPGTSSIVLSSLLPIAAGVIGREVTSRRLDAGGLAELMLAQKRIVAPSNIPFGGGTLGGVEQQHLRDRDVSVSNVPDRPAVKAEKRRSPWMLLGLGALLLGALLLLLSLGRRPATPTVSMPEAPTMETPYATRPVAPKVPEAPKVESPAIPTPTSETTVTGADIDKAPPAPATPKAEAGDVAGHFESKTSLPERFTLPGTNFEFGSTDLVAGGEGEIEKLAAAMKEHPTATVRLEGHTDNVGDAEVNSRLSYQRAAAVRKDLMDRGIDGRRIELSGKRDLGPVTGNDTASGRSQNRRVDVVIIKR